MCRDTPHSAYANTSTNLPVFESDELGGVADSSVLLCAFSPVAVDEIPARPPAAVCFKSADRLAGLAVLISFRRASAMLILFESARISACPCFVLADSQLTQFDNSFLSRAIRASMAAVDATVGVTRLGTEDDPTAETIIYYQIGPGRCYRIIECNKDSFNGIQLRRSFIYFYYRKCHENITQESRP